MYPLKVIITDEYHLIDTKIVECLKDAPDFDLSWEVFDFDKIEARCEKETPDFLICNIDFSISACLKELAKMKEMNPSMSILIVTAHEDPEVQSLLKGFHIDAIIHRSFNKAEFLEALKKLKQGEAFFHFNLDPKGSKKGKGANLTKREIEILKLIASGSTNHEIAQQLFISDRTVDTHRTNIMRKISVNNVAGLIRFAYLNKMIHE